MNCGIELIQRRGMHLLALQVQFAYVVYVGTWFMQVLIGSYTVGSYTKASMVSRT